MNKIDKKVNEHFPGLVVRKDLVKEVKGNAIVPSYVLEYLLGQYCATNDEATIQSGIATVKDILRKHYVHRNEAGLVRSTIKEKGRHKVIDKVLVTLNDKKDVYEASFENLGIKKVLVDSGTVKKHPKLLVNEVWCISDLEYEFTEDNNSSPWIMSTLKPIQMSHFDFDTYVEARKQFTTDEWIDLLMQSVGFNPEMFGKRSKLTQLMRLIPFCERNYNLIELGPKGTGKSHIYSEFSPHGILLSGGEVTVPKLFVNNSNGKIGLVGYWDTVAFDEFAGRKKKINQALVDIMKNYMANKSFSRGIGTIGAEASMVFVGNTQHTLPYMLKHSDLFYELPSQYHDSAFLDRIHFYIPGWEVDIIRGEMFSDGYGFVVDYLAEILRSLRNHDYSDRYQKYFTLSSDISTRDRDAINKTFSGLMKMLFPDGETSKEEMEEILKFAIEGRKRVKDQLMRIDSTYAKVNFSYTENGDKPKCVKTLEEEEYPNYYYHTIDDSGDLMGKPIQDETSGDETDTEEQTTEPEKEPELKEQHLTFKENMRGISYDSLIGPYLKGATEISITDPYIRQFYQARNIMELLETISKLKMKDTEVNVTLTTTVDDFSNSQQTDFLDQISISSATVGINFTWQMHQKSSQHARHIITNTGWKISLDRGLDIYQPYDMNDSFKFTNRLQQHRPCKAFEVTFIRNDKEEKKK